MDVRKALSLEDEAVKATST